MSREITSKKLGRRQWLQAAGKTTVAAAGFTLFPPSIQRALAIPAARVTGTLQDVQHVVILMQENRSFDHYFGTMSGVRGFGDRATVPLASGKRVFSQRDAEGREILPFHLDTQTTTAMRVPGTPHSWPDSQQAWDEGRFGEWARFKEFQSMGYYEEDDIPFQRALADAFTLCDAHHCAIQTGTLANRVVFMTGTNYTPGLTRAAVDQSEALIDNSNNRGKNHGLYTWKTYPERLLAAGVSTRIYQDPEENWNGLCAPWESFQAYADASPGDPLHEVAMTRHSLDELAEHVRSGDLPAVSWLVPSPVWSEHPSESSPLQGASYTQRVLDILVSNPAVWSKTVFIITFDENDGFFDHVAPPAPPSLDDAGQLIGDTTLGAAVGGEYFVNEVGGVTKTRPYGLGPRVPMYIVSPWSRGGWVCSEVFDHTSTIRFLEARFGVHEPNISPWHRAVAGDLTSCFDFAQPSEDALPELPDMSYATGETLVIEGLPPVSLPEAPRMPQQDPGVRYSRGLPYRLSAHARVDRASGTLQLSFENSGSAGAVFHVYDRLHLERVPCRYTVEAGKQLTAARSIHEDAGHYDLQILGPNGFVRRLAGRLTDADSCALPEVQLTLAPDQRDVRLALWNDGELECTLTASPNAYRTDRPWKLTLAPGAEPQSLRWSTRASGHWYDFTVTCPALPGWLRQFAGRIETGTPGVTDPALGRPPQPE